jgi:hypothetical protein
VLHGLAVKENIAFVGHQRNGFAFTMQGFGDRGFRNVTPDDTTQS